MAKKRVVLHGRLKDLYPGTIELDARNVAELVNGMCKTTKAFNPKLGQPRHVVKVVGFDTKESLFEPTDQEEIHIVPALYGGKSGGFFKIALGAVLIATVALNPAGIATATLLGDSLALGPVLTGLGVAFTLGGVLELLSPAPKLDLSAGSDPEASKYLGAPGNTTKIGTRIPLLYGEHMVWGHFLSYDIDAKDVAL